MSRAGDSLALALACENNADPGCCCAAEIENPSDTRNFAATRQLTYTKMCANDKT
jgi:hypothetical protein